MSKTPAMLVRPAERDTDTVIRCLNCRATFDERQQYQAHQWREHAGELDRGETWIAA